MNSELLSSADSVRIEPWGVRPAHAIEEEVDMLATVLHACVCTGASVSFTLPFSQEDAKAFWTEEVLPAVAKGKRCLLVARSGSCIVGTVQLDLATPPNQPHRAEVRKLLVHPKARHKKIARSLMTALEVEAGKVQRTLLTLDTVTGGPAERLYSSLGYVAVGAIPGYAFNHDSSVLESTTVMYKNLTPSE
jgi:ribosomal protein S18 acetylase RimI-like enzyme